MEEEKRLEEEKKVGGDPKEVGREKKEVGREKKRLEEKKRGWRRKKVGGERLQETKKVAGEKSWRKSWRKKVGGVFVKACPMYVDRTCSGRTAARGLALCP